MKFGRREFLHFAAGAVATATAAPWTQSCAASTKTIQLHVIPA